MAKKNTRNTKGRIIEAAWRLFYRQGYDDTTVEEIIAESGTSRGSFYHYFEGKDALLSTVSYLFDQKYEMCIRDSFCTSIHRVLELLTLGAEVKGNDNCIDGHEILVDTGGNRQIGKYAS